MATSWGVQLGWAEDKPDASLLPKLSLRVWSWNSSHLDKDQLDDSLEVGSKKCVGMYFSGALSIF